VAVEFSGISTGTERMLLGRQHAAISRHGLPLGARLRNRGSRGARLPPTRAVQEGPAGVRAGCAIVSPV
jgi:hypothetical protein